MAGNRGSLLKSPVRENLPPVENLGAKVSHTFVAACQTCVTYVARICREPALQYIVVAPSFLEHVEEISRESDTGWQKVRDVRRKPGITLLASRC